MSEITINKAKELKIKLKNDIEQLCKKFESETGLQVNSIDIDRLNHYLGRVGELNVYIYLKDI